MENTIGKLFFKRIALSEADTALGWFEGSRLRTYSYGQYKDIVEQISLGLTELGVTHATKVSILSNTCMEWHLLDISVMLSRGVTVPIYQTYTSEEVEYIFNHSDSEVLAVENDEQALKVIEVKDNLPNLKVIVLFNRLNQANYEALTNKFKVMEFSELKEMGKKAKELDAEKFKTIVDSQAGDDIASIIYTSGTTGEPKGAVITQKAFTRMLLNVKNSVGGSFNNTDRTLTWLPLSHVFGRCESFLPLVFGWEMVFAQSIDKLLENLAQVRPTIMLAVPRIFEKIYAKIMDQIEQGTFLKKKIFTWANQVSNDYHNKLEKDQSPTPAEILQQKLAYKVVFSKIYEKFGGRIRYFVSGGAPISPDIIRFLRNANLTILEGYGLTETIAPCCLNPISKQIPGTVGVPLGDVQVEFAADGEILIKSEALFQEYYKKPDATNDAIKDGWFHTGDIGEFTPEGHLRITDRKKDIIITSGGKNVAPQKIENMMKMRPLISQFVVVGDQRKYLAGVVGIEKEVFLPKLEELGLSKDITVEELSKNKQVIDLIEAEINEVNKHLASFESIKKFFVAPKEFSVETGLLTPSLKVKKKVCLEEFKSEINALY